MLGEARSRMLSPLMNCVLSLSHPPATVGIMSRSVVVLMDQCRIRFWANPNLHAEHQRRGRKEWYANPLST